MTIEKLIADTNYILQNAPNNSWTRTELPKIIKQFQKFITGEVKNMAAWKYCQVLDYVCGIYGMQLVWNERLKRVFIKVLNAPVCYNDADNRCVITYNGKYSLSQIKNLGIYYLIDSVKQTFIARYKNMPEFADAIDDIKKTM